MKKKLTTALTSIIIGGMLLSGSAIAFADTAASSSSVSNSKIHQRQLPGRGSGRAAGQFGGPAMGKMDENFADTLVKEGVIAQETADKLTAYVEEQNAERKAEMDKIKAMTAEERKAYLESKKDAASDKNEKKADRLSEMVTAGVLTQEQADAVKAYQEKKMEDLREQQAAKREEAEKSRMDGLAAAGIITQDTADAIIEYNDTREESRKAEMEKVKAMTAEERKAYLESSKNEKTVGKKDPYAGLIEEGILTQEQADSIKTYDEKQRQVRQEEQQAKRQEEMETRLAGLVEAETITEALKNKTLEYLNSQEEARKAERQAETEKVKAMTAEERKAYFESKKPADNDTYKGANKGEKVSPLKALVDDGTLTQEQADAIVKALFQKPARGN